MTDIFLKKIDDVFNDVDNLSPELLPLHVDVYRDLLSHLLSPHAISRVILTLSNLEKAFANIKYEKENSININKNICLDTSELLTAVYPNYNWYFCLKRIFLKPKSFKFFVSPWFFIETIETLKNKVNSLLNTYYENQVVYRIEKEENIVAYREQFAIEDNSNKIKIMGEDWNVNLEPGFLESLKEIAHAKEVYLTEKLKKLFRFNLMNSSQKNNVISSYHQYGQYVENLNKHNAEYCLLWEELINRRRYNEKTSDKAIEKIRYNSAIDTVSVGFLDWALKKKKYPSREHLSLLSRDSLYHMVSNKFREGKTPLHSYNAQSLYLLWSILGHNYSDKFLDKFINKSIDNISEANDLINKSIEDSLSHRLEVVEKIIYWFNQKKYTHIIDGHLVRACRRLCSEKNVNYDDVKLFKYVRALEDQTKKIDKNANKYMKIAEKLISSFEHINNQINDSNFIPLYDEVDKWADNTKNTISILNKMKDKIKNSKLEKDKKLST